MVLSNRKAETIVSFLSFISHTEATLRFSHNYCNHRHLTLEQCKLQKKKKKLKRNRKKSQVESRLKYMLLQKLEIVAFINISCIINIVTRIRRFCKGGSTC